MLSIVMFAARHFSSTIRSRGFMLGSPPPILAAMEISLLSLAKIFRRLASKAPLKCFTFAHLLCPAINQLCLKAGCIASPAMSTNRADGGLLPRAPNHFAVRWEGKASLTRASEHVLLEPE